MARINNTPLNSTMNHDGLPITTIAKVGLRQPCVSTTDTEKYDGSVPVCDGLKNLSCITGMYTGNAGDETSGVCLSTVGGQCTTIYDCDPKAHVCVNNRCEQITETINTHCKYDTDCIGGVTCKDCGVGVGPCKKVISGIVHCTELENESCPNGYIPCNTTESGEFRFNHVCDVDRNVCKYNISPKDIGCSLDSDCVSVGGGSFCIRGGFKTSYNPSGTITVPAYPVILTSSTGIIKVDFGDRLIRSESFFAGTEVNFIKSGSFDATRTTVIDSGGPYYIKESFDNQFMSLTVTKPQPSVKEYWNVPNNLIELNEEDYDPSDSADITSTYDKVVFGTLPPLIILSKCKYIDHDLDFNVTFMLFDDDPNFLLSTDNVTPSEVEHEGTEVRFNYQERNVNGFIRDSKKFNLRSIDHVSIDPDLHTGTNDNVSTTFTLKMTESDIESISPFDMISAKTLEVMFGKRVDPKILDTGICVSKLPPSANIDDARYDIRGYTGNPCIQKFDETFNVSLNEDGFCAFTEKPSKTAGSVCQFSRLTNDPLPCGDSTKTVNGLVYKLECLMSEDLSSYIRNNPNFLNPTYGGICAYPVNRKFKSCDLYGSNCRTPYVCTDFDGGTFCDSRFNALECNGTYGCPPRYTCTGGYCLANSSGICTTNEQCVSQSCKSSSLSLKFYNVAPQYEYGGSNSAIEDRIADIDTDLLSDFSLDESLKLLVLSSHENDKLTTYCQISQDGKGTLTLKITGFEAFLAKTSQLTVEPVTEDEIISSADLFHVVDYFSNRDNTPPKDVMKGSSDRIIAFGKDTSGRPTLNSHDNDNYSLTVSDGTTFPIPHYIGTLPDLVDVRFDYRHVNETELDIITLYGKNPQNDIRLPITPEQTILALRHKVLKVNYSNNTFVYDKTYTKVLSPKINIIKSPESLPHSQLTHWRVEDPVDVNTLMTFSGYRIGLVSSSITQKYLSIISTGIKMLKDISYNETEGVIITIDGDLNPGYHNIQIMVPYGGSVEAIARTVNYLPFNVYPNDFKNNFNNSLSPFLRYPAWITDLNDLFVGDTYYPTILKMYFEPNIIRDTYYIAMNMFSRYNDAEMNKLIDNEDPEIENRSTYIFRFSSSESEEGVTIDETIPIRVSPDDNFNRFAVCNETDNLFFLTNTCN